MLKRKIFAIMFAALAFMPTVVAAEDFYPEGTTAPTPTTTATNPFTKDLESGVASKLPKGYTQTDNPIVLVVRIIRVLLSFVGIGLTGLLVYAGYLWMTAAGNDDQVSTAKMTIRNAIIGMVIIAASWSLATFIINRVRGATRAGYGNLQDFVPDKGTAP